MDYDSAESIPVQPELDVSELYTYHNLVLAEVVMVKEAMVLWGKGKTTVHHHIKTGRLESRRCIGTRDTLITTKSLIALWGEPKIQIESFYQKRKVHHGHKNKRQTLVKAGSSTTNPDH